MANDKALARLLASPRRAVRYAYLRDEWPDCPPAGEWIDAIFEAPPDAVIGALTRDVETYAAVIQREKQRANEAERKLEELRAAVRLLAGIVEGTTEAATLGQLF